MFCDPNHIHNVENNIQGQINQYGWKKHVSGTIHSDMGDMLASVAT